MKNKSKHDLKEYRSLEGVLLKKSTNAFLGFQDKVWKIIQEGNKIGYRNLQDQNFNQKNIFELIKTSVTEGEDEEVFLLKTKNRIFELKAENSIEKNKWIRAITQLQKAQKRRLRELSISPDGKNHSNRHRGKSRHGNHQNKTSQGVTFLSGTTLPSFSLNRNSSSSPESEIEKSHSKPKNRKTKQFSQIIEVPQEYQVDIREYLKKMSKDHANYNTMPFRLTKVNGNSSSSPFKSNKNSKNNRQDHCYLLFSSKSLFPDKFINEDNLTSAQLPHWAEIDSFYELDENGNNQSKQSPEVKNQSRLSNSPVQGKDSKLMFHVRNIIEMKESQKYCSLEIVYQQNSNLFHNTPTSSVEFICDTLEERKKVKELLDIAKSNALEAVINGKHYKKNYDRLIQMHSYNIDDFNEKVSQMLVPYIPDNTQHHFEPNIIIKLIQNLKPMQQEVIAIMEHKASIPIAVITDFLKTAHEEVKIHLKLTWDSSNSIMKGIDILNILRNVSEYEVMIHKYLNDSELLEGMKQLSKIYVRVTYKNFQSIIISIIDQEKRQNLTHYEEEDESYLETHGIIDLFKFIYEIYQLAIPCWTASKLHLHNINKLIQKILFVFIEELKAMIDQEVLTSNKQSIALANNYFKFCKEIDLFYKDKFEGKLKEKTKETYQKIKEEYRDASMIILDKLFLPLKIQLKIHFEKQQFYKANMESVFNLIKKSTMHEFVTNFHFIFSKRYNERLFACIRQEIIKMVEKLTKNIKKKTDLPKIIEKIEQFKEDCKEMAVALCESKMKIEKQLNELIAILTIQKIEEIKTFFIENPQHIRKWYMKIISLRSDYVEGNDFFLRMKDLEMQLDGNNRSSIKSTHYNGNGRKLSNHLNVEVQESNRSSRASFSKQYMQEFQSSISSVRDKSEDINDQKDIYIDLNFKENLKLISEGYIERKKINQNQYQEAFVKMKGGLLLIYQNEKMARCQNSLKVQQIVEIKVQKADRPSFVIVHLCLNRKKQIKFKCDNIELRMRWVYSIELELKRIQNDKKMKNKSIKIKGNKNSKLVIDYTQLHEGLDYFSYATD